MLKPLVTYSLMACSSFLHAANCTQISRYASVNNQPLKAQINPLQTVQQIHFPSSILTIGEAIHYWLHYSGYHLTSKEKQSAPVQQVLQQPLPQVSRTLGPLSVTDGLRVLAGQNLFTLKQDELSREVNFNLIARGAQ